MTFAVHNVERRAGSRAISQPAGGCQMLLGVASSLPSLVPQCTRAHRPRGAGGATSGGAVACLTPYGSLGMP